MYTQEYTISSADTWEQKVLTFPGNSNLQFDNNNAVGFRVGWILAVGSGRYGTAGSWTTSSAYGTSNNVNFLDSTDNVAYIIKNLFIVKTIKEQPKNIVHLIQAPIVLMLILESLDL
jgi:hypothetical protein